MWQTVEAKQKFIAQIMSSKSPVRSCEDVDETALSYAEIKALCAGNPRIAEKMNLDIEVAKLRMLKSDYNSQHHRLEDNLLKHYPEQITAITERIAGIEKDVAVYAEATAKLVDIQTGLDGEVTSATSAGFAGMVIDGVEYKEKEPAAKALLDACKKVTDKKDVAIGSYMGFNLSLRFDSFDKKFTLLLRGAMTYQTELGTDSFGNMTRINNTLDSLTARLDGAKSQLEDVLSQQEAARQELQKPFTLAGELADKEARLALLSAELKIDGNGGMDVVNDIDYREDSDCFADDSIDDYEPPDDENAEHYDEHNQQSSYQFNQRPEVQIPQTHGVQQQRQVASAKSERPSFLDEIRAYNAGQQSGKPTAKQPNKQEPAAPGKKSTAPEI